MPAWYVNKLVSVKDYYAMIYAHAVVRKAMFDLLWESYSNKTMTQMNVQAYLLALLIFVE